MTGLYHYIGRRIQRSGDKLLHVFKIVGGRDELAFTGSGFKNCRIGSAYKMSQTDDNGKWSIPTYWIKVEDADSRADTDQRALWQAADQLAYRESIAVKHKHPELEEAVELMRRVRYSLNGVRQATFDAWLLNAVRRVPKN
jgi:hypothetical protein